MSKKYKSSTVIILCIFMITSSLTALSFSAKEVDAWEFGGMKRPKVSVDYETGSWPVSVYVSDLNGDGKMDIATANYNSNDVTVLLGDGTGYFTEAENSPFSVGDEPDTVFVSDLNGDEKMDIITANYASDDVSVLLGDGTGDFTEVPNSPFSVGDGPSSAFVTDLNKDDSMDIVTTNHDSDDISVLLGDGSGDFTEATSSPFSVGGDPISVFVSDLYGDGNMDIISANFNSDDVSVLLGDGSGDFTEATNSPFSVGFRPTSVHVSDVNRNGNLDIVTANWGSDDVTVLLGDGINAFTEATNSPFSVGDKPTRAVVTDVNNDGDMDIVTANKFNNDVMIFLGDGSGDFTEAVNSPFSIGNSPFSVVASDLNKDGNVDIVTAIQDGDTVSILLGNGRGDFFTSNKNMVRFYEIENSPISVGSGPWSVVVSDLNEDGNMDIITSNTISHDVTVLLGDGSGDFTEVPNSPFSVGYGPYSLVISDFNGDDKRDIVTANAFSHDVTLLLGDGSGDFTEAANSPFNVGGGPVSVVVSDLNEDGKMDIVTANYFTNNETILLGDGSGDFTEATNSPFDVGVGPVSVFISDLNKDGNMDIVSANNDSADVTILLGDGSGDFTEAANSPFSVGDEPYSVVVSDLNEDGNMDIVSANIGSHDVTLLLGDGTSGFTEATSSPFSVGDSPRSVSVSDLNDDGNMDIVAVNMHGADVTLLLGDGTSAFMEAANSPFSVGKSPESICISDVNGDGHFEIITANCGSNDVSVVEVLVDFDGDGVPDEHDALPWNPTEWKDVDDDSIGDFADPDDDNDGVPDVIDPFPYNAAEWNDTDNDGTGDNTDNDDDDDGYLDINDKFPTDKTEWNDTDDDGIGDNKDSDIDSDDYSNTMDRFPNDPGEWNDTDNDGVGDNTDNDIDGDDHPNDDDAFPTLATEWADFDEDGIGDNTDTDRDGDNYPDMIDRFPLDPEEWNDTDSDGLGDNEDKDIDGDSFWNDIDAFPLDPSEWFDTDEDGFGNNRDTDDDNDGAPDINDDFPEDPSKYRMESSSEDETMDIAGYTVKRQYLTYVAPALTVLVAVFLFVNKRGRMALYMSKIKKAASLAVLEEFFEKKVEVALGKEKIKSEQYLALQGQREKRRKELGASSLEDGLSEEEQLKLLRERLAKGEISEDMYRNMERKISSQPLPAREPVPALSPAQSPSFAPLETNIQAPQVSQPQWQQGQPASPEIVQFTPETWACSQCGRAVDQSLSFCNFCGSKRS